MTAATCERLGDELASTQVLPAESSQEAINQATVCRQAMSLAPVAIEPDIPASYSAREEDVPPESYLLRLLEKRGRHSMLLSSTEAGYTNPPTEKQIKDYSSKPFITDLVRKGDIEGLEQALRAGRGMVRMLIERLLYRHYTTRMHGGVISNFEKSVRGSSVLCCHEEIHPNPHF